MLASTGAIGNGRAVIFFDNTTENLTAHTKILFSLQNSNPLPMATYFELSLTDYSCPAMSVTISCVSDTLCKSDATATLNASTPTKITITGLLKTYVFSGSHLEFSMSHNCNSLIPSVGSATNLNIFAKWKDPTDSSSATNIKDIESYKDIKFRKPNKIGLTYLSSSFNGEKSGLKISFDLIDSVVQN